MEAYGNVNIQWKLNSKLTMEDSAIDFYLTYTLPFEPNKFFIYWD